MHRSTGITVRELLNLDVLKAAKVMAAENNLDKVITKINVMEVPDIVNWVEKGEFLLTTAFSIKDNLEKLEELIIQFNEKGLAGLGIKTKRYIDEIPQRIIDIANGLGFPLIEIPYEVSYSTIIVQGLTEIINHQTHLLKRIDTIHNQLLNVMLNGGSLKDIGIALYESIDKNTLAISEYLFDTNVIICEDESKIEIENIIKKEKRKNINLENLQKLIYPKVKDNINGVEVDRITVPIYTKERVYGYIYIWENHKKITPVELTTIEASTSIVALELFKKLSVFETESKYKIEFFEDLFSSDKGRHEKAIDRASYFGFNNKLSHSVIIISIEDIQEFNENSLNNSSNLQQINMKLLRIINRLTKHRDKKIICGNKSNKIIALYSWEANGKAEKLKKEIMEFSNEIFKYAKFEGIDNNVSIGIGRVYEKTEDLWRSYREANRAVDCIRTIQNKKISHYDDLGIYRILSYQELQPELKQFYQETLEPLVNYDKEKGTELVETMKMFFKYGGNLKKISEEMFTHYNTIIYRMQRIKEISGIDIEDYEERLNIQISLKVLDML